MRIAALAFGVLAGLVASLILALGGLDAAAMTGVDPRQLSVLRFGLYIIANFGVFGAGVVLASPLGGAILLLLGAVGWIAAAVVLHHGPDYVMLTPPVLLLVSAVLAVLAFRRRQQQDFELEPLDARPLRQDVLGEYPDEDEQADVNDGGEPAAVPVGASFFGDAGTATPLRGAINRPPEPRESGVRPQAADDWEPIRRATPPPRQRPAFRQPDDYEDEEESGFSRVARGISAVLSFGLYAALAGAAILIVWNLRTLNAPSRPSAVKLEASLASSSAPATSSSSRPPMQEAALSPALQAPSLAPAMVAPSSAMAAVTGGPMDDATRQLMGQDTSFGPANAADNSGSSAPPGFVGTTSSAPAGTDGASTAPASEASSDPASDLVVPYPMPAEIAAARSRPAPRFTPTRPSGSDTGL